MNTLKQGGPSVTIDCINLLISEGSSGVLPDIVFLEKIAEVDLFTSLHMQALGIVLFSHGTLLFQRILRSVAIESLVPFLF